MQPFSPRWVEGSQDPFVPKHVKVLATVMGLLWASPYGPHKARLDERFFGDFSGLSGMCNYI